VKALLADRGYDANAIRKKIAFHGNQAEFASTGVIVAPRLPQPLHLIPSSRSLIRGGALRQ
jgi:hypothetical protein